MQQQFLGLADFIQSQLRTGEGYLAEFSGETSQFVRFNRSAVRQAGAVEQRYLTLELFRGKRHASQQITLTGHDDTDTVTAAVLALRDVLSDTPEDPHFLINETPLSTTRVLPNQLPAEDEALAAIIAAGKGHDLVGLYAAGPIHRGFANSYGQRNWDTAHAFAADLSFFLQSDKAVKVDHAGTAWDASAVAAKMDGATARLEALAHPKPLRREAIASFWPRPPWKSCSVCFRGEALVSRPKKPRPRLSSVWSRAARASIRASRLPRIAPRVLRPDSKVKVL